MKKSEASADTDLWLFTLHTPDAVQTVHDRVLWHDLTRVHLAARADDAATGQDHVSPKISWDLMTEKKLVFNVKINYDTEIVVVGQSEIFTVDIMNLLTLP